MSFTTHKNCSRESSGGQKHSQFKRFTEKSVQSTHYHRDNTKTDVELDLFEEVSIFVAWLGRTSSNIEAQPYGTSLRFAPFLHLGH